jgi:hypothetical protein
VWDAREASGGGGSGALSGLGVWVLDAKEASGEGRAMLDGVGVLDAKEASREGRAVLDGVGVLDWIGGSGRAGSIVAEVIAVSDPLISVVFTGVMVV